MHNAEGKREGKEGAKAKEAEDGFCDRQFKVAGERGEDKKKRDSLIALICGSNDRAHAQDALPAWP